jgi:hypothetical protein
MEDVRVAIAIAIGVGFFSCGNADPDSDPNRETPFDVGCF